MYEARYARQQVIKHILFVLFTPSELDRVRANAHKLAGPSIAIGSMFSFTQLYHNVLQDSMSSLHVC